MLRELGKNMVALLVILVAFCALFIVGDFLLHGHVRWK